MQPIWKKYLLYASITIGTAVSVLIVLRIIFLGYTMASAGFRGSTSLTGYLVQVKTLWDLMGVFIFALALAGGAFYLIYSEREAERKRVGENAKLEREIAADHQQKAALQAYLDYMAELLEEKNLRTSANEEVRNDATLQTLSVLEGLDGRHRGMIVRFLKESSLIEGKPIIALNRANLEKADLERADLQGANLQGAYLYLANLAGARLIKAKLAGADLYFANLREADLGGADLERANLSEARLLLTDLSGANLSEADLGEANLERANLSQAKLSLADLSGANLSEADLSGADLSGAKVTGRHLATAGSLKGATMPDGTKHE